jgi:hypothetical protein
VKRGRGKKGKVHTVLLGGIAEVLEEPTPVLPSDEPELAPCCCGRAGDVAEAVPIADATKQCPEDEGPDGSH